VFGNGTHGAAGFSSARSDFGLRARWFEAMCTVVRNTIWRGLYFWDIDFSQNVWQPSPQSDPPLSFIGRLGALAVRSCFADPARSWQQGAVAGRPDAESTWFLDFARKTCRL
jgi:hypothetical protein